MATSEAMDELRKQVRAMVDKFADELVTLTVKEGNRMTVIRLREARANARARGGKFGKLSYGEHPGYPDEKRGVELMTRLHKEGHPYRTICEHMEKHDMKLRSGGNWNPGTVLRILRHYGVVGSKQ